MGSLVSEWQKLESSAEGHQAWESLEDSLHEMLKKVSFPNWYKKNLRET